MFTVIVILSIIAAILLILVVLLQPGKGDLSASFGGIGSQMGSMFGMQKTANILAKITKYLAAFIVIMAILVNKFFIEPDEAEFKNPSVMGRNVGEVQRSVTPEQQAPQQAVPGAQQQQAQPKAETKAATEKPATDPAPAKTEEKPAK
jgi:preprotein translocase subunit SecG